MMLSWMRFLINLINVVENKVDEETHVKGKLLMLNVETNWFSVLLLLLSPQSPAEREKTRK